MQTRWVNLYKEYTKGLIYENNSPRVPDTRDSKKPRRAILLKLIWEFCLEAGIDRPRPINTGRHRDLPE